MVVQPSVIHAALKDLVSYEEGMRFQRLAVVLAKKRWPDLIASERKSDLGADAIAKPVFAAEGIGKVLACSITGKLSKVRQDAEKIKAHFPHIKNLTFATPAVVSAKTAEAWAAAIQKESPGGDRRFRPRFACNAKADRSLPRSRFSSNAT